MKLSMSLEIKCLWNHGMKLSIESGCFIQVLFYFTWHSNIGNNAMKLSTETGLAWNQNWTAWDGALSPITDLVACKRLIKPTQIPIHSCMCSHTLAHTHSYERTHAHRHVFNWNFSFPRKNKSYLQIVMLLLSMKDISKVWFRRHA